MRELVKGNEEGVKREKGTLEREGDGGNAESNCTAVIVKPVTSVTVNKTKQLPRPIVILH